MSHSKDQLISDSTLIKLQAGSGLMFGSFLGLHLLNHLTAPFGEMFYDGVQDWFRYYYQNPLIEITCIGTAAVVHSAVSFVRIYRRQKKQIEKPVEKNAQYVSTLKIEPLNLHRYAGYTLSAFIVGHALATRGVDLVYDRPADFALVSFALKVWPTIFWPYYLLLGSSGIYHLSYGAIQSFRVFQVKTPSWLSTRGKIFKAVVGTSCVGLVIAIASFAGSFGNPIPTHKFAEIRQLYEIMVPKSLHSLVLPWTH